MILRLFAVALLLAAPAYAQVVIQPLPLRAADFKAVAQGGYTKCSVFQLQDGVKILTADVEYGAKGYAIGRYNKSTDDDDKLATTDKVEYKYNAQGAVVEEYFESIEDEDRKVAHTWNSKGQLTQTISLEIDPPTSTFKYDSAGRLTEVMVTRRMPTVDDSGEPTGKAFDFPWTRSSVKTDAQGRVVEKLEHDLRSDEPKKPTARYTWVYSASGNITQYKYESVEGDRSYTVDYVYGKDGVPSGSTETRTWGDETEVLTFVYEWHKANEAK